jgi:heterogeneous nuclear rnp K-like protein 2
MDSPVEQQQGAATGNHFPGDQFPSIPQGYYGNTQPPLFHPFSQSTTANTLIHGAQDASLSPTHSNSMEGSVTLRVLLNSKGAGVVIGKGGKTVEEMREFSGAKAGVSKQVEGVNDRILTISGTIDQSAKAVHFLASTLVDTPCMTFQPPLPPSHTLVRLLVPNSIMGSVIGRSGQRIKQIQENNGVRLVAAKEPLPNSTERLTDISGTPEGIEGASRDIAQSLHEEWERVAASTVLYDPRVRQRGGSVHPSHNHVSPAHGLPAHSLHPSHLAGNSNHPGLGPQQHQQSRGVTNMGMNHLHSAHTGGINSMSGVSSLGPYQRSSFHLAATQMIASLPTMNLAPSGSTGLGHPGNNNMARYPPMHQHRLRPHHHPNQSLHQEYIPKSDDPNAITQTIAIPSDMVGCIIGKGGSRIGAIREHSGSKISVSKVPNSTGERIFTIVGTRSQNDVALKMLYEQLAEEKERRLTMEQHVQQQTIQE